LEYDNAPTMFLAEGNYGSPGYRSVAGGTASVADGATISHTLPGSGAGDMPIPTKAQVTPAIAARFAAVTSIGPTTIGIALKNSTGGAVSTPENVRWRVEL
jgi:hypothetical protein